MEKVRRQNSLLKVRSNLVEKMIAIGRFLIDERLKKKRPARARYIEIRKTKFIHTLFLIAFCKFTF